jgi:hypothetical protein
MSSISSGPILKKFLLEYTLSEIDRLNNQEFVFNMMLEELYETFGLDVGGEYTIEEIKRELMLLSMKRDELRSKYCKYLH